MAILERLACDLALTDAQIDVLRNVVAPTEVRMVASGDEATMRRILPSSDALLTGGRVEPWFVDGDRLGWVHCAHAGIERSARPEILASRLTVTGSAGRSAPAIADHALAFMLALAHDLAGFHRAQRRRRWWRGDPSRLRTLQDRTVVIVGVGHTGRALAVRAAALEMRVRGFRRRSKPCPPGFDEVRSSDEGHDVRDTVADAEFVVLAASLNDASHHLVDRVFLDSMRNDAFLVNVGRGGLVDERALVHALRAGELAGAALDVTETEPLPRRSPLWRAPRLLITPHISPVSPERTDRVLDLVGRNASRYRAGRPLENQLGPDDVLTPRER